MSSMTPKELIEELEAIQHEYSPNPPERLQRLINKLKKDPGVHRGDKGQMEKD